MVGAKGPAYRVPFRRRREGKTDYRKRLKLLLSRKPRVVVRRSNKLIRLQLVATNAEGDRTLASAISSELKAYGYTGGTCNIPSAYLTGLLFGLRARAAGYTEGIADIGRHTPTKGATIYAALKGALDSGLSLPCDHTVFPVEERLFGAHIASYKGDPSIVEMIRSVKERMMSAARKEVESSPA